MVIMSHPQSLKILKSSDLMPYVVFVAPPSLQQVDLIKMRNTLDFTSRKLVFSDICKRQTVSSHDKINVKVFAIAREAIKTGVVWFSQGREMDEIV